MQTLGATKHLQDLQTVAAHAFLDGELAGAGGAGRILLSLSGEQFYGAEDNDGVLRASAEGRLGMLFSVNKMLESLSNTGRGFCVGRARVSHEAWVTDFARYGSREMAWESGILSWELGWDSLSSSALDRRGRNQVVTKLRYRTARLPGNLRSDYCAQ
jgi:hypothetical protein